MASILLDTHALIWLVSGQPLSAAALRAIFTAQADGTLFISPITAWEAGSADRKRNPVNRPDLLGMTVDLWFHHALRSTSAKLA